MDGFVNVHLYNHNNYFNREIKSMPINTELIETVENVNFDPKDGITTSIIVNMTDGFHPDYVQIMDRAYDEDILLSSWFVIEQIRKRSGQYELQLRRDVIFDHYNTVVEAPCFIEKGMVQSDNPLILNSENMTYNQIKKSETLLKDEYGCGWIVGYYTNDSLLNNDMVADTAEDPVQSIDLTTWAYKDYCSINGSVPTRNLKVTDPGRIKITYKYGTNPLVLNRGDTYFMTSEARNLYGTSTSKIGKRLDEPRENFVYFSNTTNGLSEDQMNPVKELFQSSSYRNYVKGDIGVVFLEDVEDIELANKHIIRDSNSGKYYNVTFVIPGPSRTSSTTITRGQQTASLVYFDAALKTCGSDPMGVSESISIDYGYSEGYIKLVEFNYRGTYNVKGIPQSAHKRMDDAPYYAFAIPCPQQNETCEYAGFTYTYSESLAVAQAIAKALQPSTSGGALLDLQLLPYRPPLEEFGQSSQYGFIVDSDDIQIGCVYRLMRSSFDGIIDYEYNVEDVKISNETDVFRLVAPNFSSTYDFSAAKNDGIHGMHFNCTYKPYNPYINVHLNYGGFYGADFEDNRGLTCGGDYSLPVLSDAWTSYQIQNKNYSAIFDREIKNMDFNNAWQMAEGITAAASGTVVGSVVGSVFGGPGVAAAGLASGIGGILDIVERAQTQQENKSFKTDMYGYQLGNIQAKPNSLVKTSSFDRINRIWPILEYFSCTDVEREALRNKLKYNGMTVMTIAKIEDYIIPGDDGRSYIQGKLIRLSDLSEDSHLANEIYNEVAKGLYLNL